MESLAFWTMGAVCVLLLLMFGGAQIRIAKLEQDLDLATQVMEDVTAYLKTVNEDKATKIHNALDAMRN